MADTPKSEAAPVMPRRFPVRLAWAIFLVAGLIVFATYQVWAAWRAETERHQRHEAWAVRRAARSAAIEQGSPGSVRLFVRPAAGEVVWDGVAIKCSMTVSPYIWKVPPPNGAAIPLTADTDDELIFFACSKQPNAKGFRTFVFPAPVYQRILRDEDVDWDSQRAK